MDNSILLHGNNKGAIDLVLNVTPYGSILPIGIGLWALQKTNKFYSELA